MKIEADPDSPHAERAASRPSSRQVDRRDACEAAGRPYRAPGRRACRPYAEERR